MKIKVKKLLALMEQRGMTAMDLARETDIEVTEIEKLLGGEAVGKDTASAFISYFGADTAQGIIDWAAIGKVNPLACAADNDTEDGE